MSRPVIGVTTSQRSGWRIFPLVALNVFLAGGRAVRWGVRQEPDLEKVHGIVIGGGDDISPDFYGGRLQAAARLDPARDTLEHDLCCAAFERNIPVLGICRGSQMLNVALGGDLHQDAFSVYETSRRYKTILPRRRVTVVPGTRLAGIAGKATMHVNALHSQSVARLGHGLEIAARDEGGMVQAIERVRDPFAVGVQWHPEHLFYRKRQRAIFRALVHAAGAYRETRGQVEAVDRGMPVSG
ncbi:gamma-glutamyl-gamma-aminobutyrate hydrolase family protein [Psychromarinibacter halotolerans]|uniref:Gamma-glutamyl-gamma-aminobutyrate hydrolase family protein n=1 Tax=Psychromarinibacter halotolerans TaxID=1775175 RepID=A0ABV7GUE3_9RHOB|nr:gamma-glutamyl-gamma-aminobutyrate hydrolase family protein [Psychromarinibacter halotolerans]MDF0594881.1 gamma-glutamyl-gamma-aminobutyrate hydrolase family protein [Psychromarinibacter halotolerans]